jgi:cytoskeletal protein RodZ
MSTHGFVTEDDLILYAMQALPDAEMSQVAAQLARDGELARRLREVESVLGLYASATTAVEDVPAGALRRLQDTIEQERPAALSARVPSQPALASDRPARERWSLGLLWAGWALAASLLVTVGLLFRHSRAAEQETATQTNNLRNAQSQIAELAAERDQLRSSLQQESAQVSAEREAAAQAQNRADTLSSKTAALTAKATQADQNAQRTAAQVEALTATANQTEAERRRLGEALTHEQQIAAAAAESQQVLAALSDPSALHVTLTEPKEKKRPSGRGTYLASTGTLVFTGSNLNSLPADKVYELWLMPANGASPIPAGTFTPDKAGNATIITQHFQHGAAAGFAITVEKAGGSLTPTLPIVLVGLSG